jgi:hypothetical protein
MDGIFDAPVYAVVSSQGPRHFRSSKQFRDGAATCLHG